MEREEFLKKLKQYEEAYYSGEALISDEEYDALRKEYEGLYGEYIQVPNEGKTGFNKIKHLYPLKSLKKVQLSNKGDLEEEIKKLLPVVIQPKFDGLSIEIQLTDERLKFITRGDGEVGDDVTAQCMQIEDVDMLYNLFTHSNQSFRAEIIMTHQDFDRLNSIKSQNGEELLSNPRNAAAGMLRNKDLSKIDGLTIMIYEDLSSKNSQSKEINFLKDLLEEAEYEGTNIRITPYTKHMDMSSAITILSELESYRNLIDYDIDGWVVKSDKPNSLEIYGGYTGHHPKNAFAVKGEAKGAWTTIESITWQAGKEYITPVAELEPVEVDGSVISRATLHNISHMQSLNLYQLCYDKNYKSLTKAYIVKANDIIPKIIKIDHNFTDCYRIEYLESPDNCPACGGITALKEDTESEILTCSNVNCTAKILKRAAQLVGRDGLNIVGISEKTIQALINYEDNFKHHSDILEMGYFNFVTLDGFAEKSALKTEDAIEKAREEQPLNRVIYAAAIPLVGRDASKRLAETYNYEELIAVLKSPNAIDEITAIKGIGNEIALSLIANYEEIIKVAKYIRKIKDIKKKAKATSSNQLTFCITGAREPFKTMIQLESSHRAICV